MTDIAMLSRAKAGVPQARSVTRSLWTDRKIAALLGVGSFAVYLAVLHGVIDVYDSQAMVSVTQNLVNHGTLRTTGAGWSLGSVSTPFAPYGLGLSLLAVPFYALSKLFGHPAVLESLVSPLVTSISVVLIYRIARVLDWRPSHGVLAAVSYGIFSMAIWYSTELLSEPSVTVCILIIVLGMLRWRQGARWAPLWIGIAAGVALQLRTDAVVTAWIGLLAIPLFVPLTVWRSLRALGLVLGPMAVSCAVLGWYDELRFHRLIEAAYGPGGGFSTPLWHGLDGLLFSPGRSLFLYNPLTVLGVVGLILLLAGPGVVRDRPLGVLLAILIVTRTVFYAKWGVWDGGWTWGPRFLLPVVALLCVALPTVLRATDPRRAMGLIVRAALVLLAVLGAAVNFLAVRVPFGVWVTVLSNSASHPAFGIHGLRTFAQQEAALDFQLNASPIRGDIALLMHEAVPYNSELWSTGHSLIGLLLVAAGAVCITLAVVGSRSLDRRAPVGRPVGPHLAECISNHDDVPARGGEVTSG